MPAASLHPRLRVLRGKEIALGPGKAELLEAISRTGKLGRAADDLGMSYMRAWNLVRLMNRGFREPLVELARGGRAHGGAALTETGTAVLSLYRQMEKASIRASDAAWNRLRALLKP